MFKKFGKFILSGLAFLVVVIAGIIFFVFTASGPATQVAQDFFDTMEKDPVAAYKMTDEGFKAGTTEEDFVLFVESYPFLRNIDSISFPNRSVEAVDGETRYTLMGNLYNEEAGNVPVVIMLVDNGDGIEVYGMEISPDEIPEL